MKLTGFDRLAFMKKLGWLGAELVVVFIGVFGAFLLDDYRSHRRDLEQREQILTWFQHVLSGAVRELDSSVPEATARSRGFLERYEAGEMPDLDLVSLTSGFDAHLWESMLQSAGPNVIEVELIAHVGGFLNMVRFNIELWRRHQRLCDQWVLPRLGQGKEAFYDTETGKLRKSFEWYLNTIRQSPKRTEGLATETRKLLERIERALSEPLGR